jgi:hypothetical protein
VNEAEIAQLLADVEQLLTELGLGFIVAQERVLAAEGVSRPPEGASPSGSAGGTYGFWTDEPEDSMDLLSAGPQVEGAESRRHGRPRFKRGDVVVTPLDPRARLEILFDLVEVATAGTLAMERDVQEHLERLQLLAVESRWSERTPADPRYATAWEERWNGSVTFVDPPEAELRGQSLPAWKLESADTRRVSAQRARTVISTLDALRAEAGVPRGAWLNPYSDDDREDRWRLERGPM